jgi:glucokinase
MRLVADIGGTNSRLALGTADHEGGTIGRVQSYRNADFDRFEDVVTAFLPTGLSPSQLVVAMAGPVTSNRGRLTNLDWVIDGEALAARYCGAAVRVINDLTALGYAALRLTAGQLIPLRDHPVAPASQKQALVVGIGTGFNVSPAIKVGETTICPAVEAGHTTLYTSIAAQLERLQPQLSQAFPTTEALFSGRGRRLFLSHLTGQTVDSATPYIARQGQADNAAFDVALDHYAVLIGMLLAELKVAHLPNDGLFLAGGVMRSSLTGGRQKLCAEAALRENAVVKITPPIAIIADDTAALLGCASVEV